MGELPLMSRRQLLTAKLVVMLFAFVGCVAFWFWTISSGDNSALLYSTVYTVLTLWTFDNWITIKRQKP